MKKYLMTGIAAVAMCAAFTSCSHDEITQFTQEELNQIEAQKMIANYEAAFIKAFGQPAANQDWGFNNKYNATRAATRGSVVKPDMTDWPSAIAPGPLEPGEAEAVTDWFHNHPGFSTETLTWKNYFVQHVSYKTQEQGIWHHHDSNHPENDWDEVKTYDFTLDQLKVGSDQTHVLDYNATKCANGQISDTRYIKNSDTNDFSVLISWATSNESHLYKLAKITYNGKTNYYVGFTAWGEKENNGIEELGAQNKTVCDDWIIKIVPGETEEEDNDFDGRIMCEDLNATDDSDFDFNDVVFDYKISGNTATIKLRAAGGTYPLYVGDVEVHGQFGYTSTNIMINTGAGPTATAETYTYTFPNGTAALPINIPIVVVKNDVPAPLSASTGLAASKIHVPTSTRWLREFQKITWGYPSFGSWVDDPADAFWAKDNINSSFLY